MQKLCRDSRLHSLTCNAFLAKWRVVILISIHPVDELTVAWQIFKASSWGESESQIELHAQLSATEGGHH